MSCIIKIGNQSVSEADFLKHLNKIISVNNLFNENTELASQIYEAAGFKQLPKLKEGFFRFYRGETSDKTDFSKLPAWMESNAGNWWSNRESKAVEFAGYRDNAKTFYLDIPTKIVEQFRGDELSGTTGDEYLIPKEIQEKYGKYEFNSITPQQKQEVTFMFSEFLDVYLQDFEQVEKILKEEKVIDKKCS